MMEVNEAASVITENADPNARVIFGASTDETLKKGEIKITVVATGFDEKRVIENPIERLNRKKIEMDQRIMEEPKDPTPVYAPVSEPVVQSPQPKVMNPGFDMSAIEELLSSSSDSKVVITEAPQREIKEEDKKLFGDSNSSDDLEIPTFIRKKMGK